MKSILIVEDDVGVRQLLTEFLGRHHNYNTTACYDGEEAVKIFAKQDFDLVLLDMIMPVMNGPECFKRLKEMKPNVKVIIMSGYCNSRELQHCLDNGAIKFFHKPFRPDELVEYIEKVLC